MANARSVVKRIRPAQSSLEQKYLEHCTSYPSCRRRNSTLLWLTARVMIVLLTVAPFRRAAFVKADEENTVCGCSPPTYTFLLNFTLFCPPIDIDRNPGIESLECLIRPLGAPTTDLVPVVVTSVDVFELDQSRNVLQQTPIDGPFLSGESFSYASILNDRSEIDSTEQIPRALQVILYARNEEGVNLVNVFTITFSNQCGAVPVFETSTSVQSAGWAILSVLGNPVSEFCPTFAPTSSPTVALTDSPSQTPSTTPTQQPTLFPTGQPTPQPETPEPMSSPTTSPTIDPVARPTLDPSEPPTSDPPLETPSPRPMAPSQAPETQLPTNNPVTPTGSVAGTELPTEVPTITRLPSISIVPSAMPFVVEMSMSLTLFDELDLRQFLLLEDELDFMDSYINKKHVSLGHFSKTPLDDEFDFMDSFINKKHVSLGQFSKHPGET